MKKYDLTLLTFVQKKRKDKIKREAIKFQAYRNIPFDLAKYYAVKAGCGLRFLDKEGNLTDNANAFRAIGYSYWQGQGIFAFINPIYKPNWDGSFKYPVTESTTFDTKVDFSKIEHFFKEEYFDYSIEAYNSWAPKHLIPKGYQHINEGIVQQGDLYWEKDYFIEVEVGFSSYKPGVKIEKTGMKHVGKQGGRIEDEVFNWYSPFIIRKK